MDANYVSLKMGIYISASPGYKPSHLYTLSHPENDPDITECAKLYTQ